ncbi:hypothetical protein IFM89_003501 [Coptis chinensis]|uniref:PUB 62/63 C-terminal domain-containing protein n=1 Tax=Coptis chinensis TaxID=261450 RepID=A0A835HC66_9MAGN|nr:hypothetical protein IFM89_003501 [Coptis chinensis]
MENGLNSQLVFQDETLQFNCGASPQRRIVENGRKGREMSGFVTEKMFSIEGERYFGTQSSEFRRNMNVFEDSGINRERRENLNWNNEGSTDTPSGEGSEGDEEEEDDDVDEDDDEGDGEVEGLVGLENNSIGNKNTNNNNNSSGSVHSSGNNEKANLQKQSSSLGSSRGVLMKDGNNVNGVHSANNIRGSCSSGQHHQQGRVNHFENAVSIAEPDLYYSQFLQGPEGGTLMDDAMILPCGHSFGSGGLQHVFKMRVCYTCQQSVTEDSVAPNLWDYATFARLKVPSIWYYGPLAWEDCSSVANVYEIGPSFQVGTLRLDNWTIICIIWEEELSSCRASKKRRERFEQDKSSCGDLSMYFSRGKGVQFPFAVTDRVVIKGNKRTPLRFVGREAVVTTQCLNGWYVVKTLDNAESVKLQYRSLAKVSDSSSNMASSKTTPNWL